MFIFAFLIKNPMNSIFHFLFLFIFFSQNLFAQPATSWSNLLGSDGMDVPTNIIQTSDDGYIFIGTSDNNNQSDLWVVKISASGNQQWSKKYGDSNEDEFGYAICLSDNGYILAGVKNNQSWILKISSTGTIIWEKSYGDIGIDIPSSIFSVTGGYVLGGTSFSANHSNGLGDYWILKFDDNGNQLWEKFYGGSLTEKLSQLIPTSDGGMIAVGTTSSNDGDVPNLIGQSDIFIVKMNGTGDMSWSKTYGGLSMDIGASICEVANNQYVFTGTKGILNLDATGIQKTFDNNVFVATISSTGNIVWQKNFGGSNYDFGSSISVSNNGVIVGGRTISYDGDISSTNGGFDTWLFELNNQGDLEWQKSYGGDKNDILSQIIPDNNGGFVIINSTNSKNSVLSSNHGNHDAWVFKLQGNAILNVDLGIDRTICQGETIELNATIPNCTNCTYLWSTNQTNPKITVSPTTTTTYSVTVTKAGLQDSDNIKISVATKPNITETITPVDCNGANTGKISLSVSSGFGPFDYKWSNNQLGTNIYNLYKGAYSVTITDAIECTYEETFNVTQPEPLTNEATIENICGQNTKGSIALSPSGGVGNYSYLWNDAITTKNRSNLNQGFYSVTISDENSCSLIESFEIAQNSISFSPSIDNISCYGKNDGRIDLGLNGSTSSYTIKWNYNNFKTPIIEHLPAGNYSVTITNIMGCSSMESFTISQPNQIIVTPNVVDNLCADEMKGHIELSILGGTSPYEFDWSNDKKTPKISNLSSGKYYVTVTDDHQCSLTRNYFVKEPTKLKILGTENDIKCAGENTGSIVIIVSGGIPDYDITLNGNTSTTGLINELLAGEYVVVAKDQNNCEQTKTYIVNEPNPLKLDVDVQHPTIGNNDGFIKVTPSGGTPDYSIVWDDGTLGPIHNNFGKGIYNVMVSDANGCQKDTTITLMEVAVNDIQNSDLINIYPNPTSGDFIIESMGDKIQSVVIFNALGEQIIINNNISSKINVNLSNYSNGIYYLLVYTLNETYSEKVVLTKNY